MGHHRAITIITRPPGYRGGARPLRVLAYSTAGAILLGVTLGLALAAGTAFLVTGVWPWSAVPPRPCPQIAVTPSPDPLDSQWVPD